MTTHCTKTKHISDHKETEIYHGFEQGPIRPPSEAYSLLIRVTRNCPWNRCTFCPVYKGTSFSIRPVEHVLKDIDTIHHCVSLLQHAQKTEKSHTLSQNSINTVAESISPQDIPAFQAAVHWMMNDMTSIFLQDANSLVIKPAHLIQILTHLKTRFPHVQRITSYARSETINRLTENDLKEIAQVGLNRLHLGLESGCNDVLERVKKGTTKEIHIQAGLKVKAAGIELSEYVIPGLGGVELSEQHARETAETLNQINPDFIRLRTLALPDHLELYEHFESGKFQKSPELATVKEILLLLEQLNNITSTVKSDHILNLFQEVEGQLPQDKEYMTGILKTFLAMDTEDQVAYQLGRRLGIFRVLADMQDTQRREKVRQVYTQLQITQDNVDEIINDLTKRFI